MSGVELGCLAKVKALPPKVMPTFGITVQLISTKKVVGAEGASRYRGEVTDGADVISAMIASQYVPEIDAGQIMPGSIINIDKFMINEVKGIKYVTHRVLIFVIMLYFVFVTLLCWSIF